MSTTAIPHTRQELFAQQETVFNSIPGLNALRHAAPESIPELEAKYPDAAFALMISDNLFVGDREQNEIHQLAFDVVVHLELAGFLAQKHSAAAAEDFDVAPEFLWEHGQDDRQQVRLVADAGYWGSDRLSHAPIQIDTAGTVPGVRLLYRPFGLFSFLFWEHLSLNLRRFFIDITSLQGLQIFV